MAYRPERLPGAVPYQAFSTQDGWIVVAVGNDRQWQRFCQAIGHTDLAEDSRFTTNADRVTNRSTLVPTLEAIFLASGSEHWLRLLNRADIPCGPVNTVDRALESEQVAARGMVQEIAHPAIGPVRMVASPLKLESTPPTIRRHPPMLGEHTEEVLAELLHISQDQLDYLRQRGAIQ